jgi:hypothetical protein
MKVKKNLLLVSKEVQELCYILLSLRSSLKVHAEEQFNILTDSCKPVQYVWCKKYAISLSQFCLFQRRKRVLQIVSSCNVMS